MQVDVSVIATHTISDPNAPPAAIRPEDFFIMEGSGKRYDVWNGNSVHVIPKPEDRLQVTKLPNPRDSTAGKITFDVPEGALKLGYLTPKGDLYPGAPGPSSATGLCRSSPDVRLRALVRNARREVLPLLKCANQ